MRALVLAVSIGMMGGPAAANVITLTGTGVFDLVETGIECNPCGPADAAPLQITRAYTLKLNDEVGDLRLFKYNIDGFGDTYNMGGEFLDLDDLSEDRLVRNLNINSRGPAPVPGYQFNSIANAFDVVLSRGPSLGSYVLESISVSGATVSDRWDLAVIGDSASRAYLGIDDPGYQIARYSGTVDWTLDVSPIPVPAAAPLLATALGLLAVARRRRMIRS